MAILVNPIYLEFGRIIAAKRKQLLLSQAAFGNLVGLSRTSITNIEKGRQPVQLHQLLQFAMVLRVRAEEILPRMIEPRPEASTNKLSYARDVRRSLNLGE
jgi:transcriptional regulator with XRE-family HTH domain